MGAPYAQLKGLNGLKRFMMHALHYKGLQFPDSRCHPRRNLKDLWLSLRAIPLCELFPLLSFRHSQQDRSSGYARWIKTIGYLRFTQLEAR